MRTRNKKVFGVGSYDLPVDLVKGTENYVIYSRWYNMLRRVFDVNYHNKRPTYKGCEVSDEWLLFSKFDSDLREMKCYEKLFTNERWCLDKDLIGSGKTYSRQNCCIIPCEVNNFVLDNSSKMGSYPTGVKFNKSKGKLEANLNKFGKRVYLGTFEDVELALTTYREAKAAYAKELSAKWFGILDEKVIEFLNNYSPAYKVNAVEVDDEDIIFKY